VSDSVIAVEGLVKAFGRVQALDGLDLSVERGGIHGFLGPNGSGKTTTLRVLLGMLRADGGQALLFGRDPWKDAVALHGLLAYVPGEVALWPGLSGGETIDLLGRLRCSFDEKRRARMLERFDLDPSTKVTAYSKGNRQKVALIAALACDVELYLFDEPTDGLDPLMAETFRECVTELAGDGRTVLLSSHVLAEVDAVCDRISIIRSGRTVETGLLSDMRHLARTAVEATTERRADLSGLSGVADLVVDGTTLRCAVDAVGLPALLERLSQAGVQTLVSRPPTLEEMFLRYYDRDPS
jgi:ABC-2 type transport system ATP-binding protein